MADDLPYEVITSKGSIIEVPPHWGNDDWPPFAHMEELDYVMPVRGPSDGDRWNAILNALLSRVMFG